LLSVDTNILLYSLNRDCPEHTRAQSFLAEIAGSQEVLICELVLVELYLLLRNPVVLKHPLDAPDASRICQRFRANPAWRLVEQAPVMSRVWRIAAQKELPRRRIIDARLALTLLHHGVTELATRNTRDFTDLGFERVWDPLL
jgi:toxin-antitoxin system PIN domain toxin